MPEIVFWQDIVSPHMAGLARALAARGATVRYVAAKAISEERESQGWSPGDLRGMDLEELALGAAGISALLDRIPGDAIHLTQGVRRNGPVAAVHRMLHRRRARWGAMLETLDDRGLTGCLKRLDYRLALGPTGGPPDFVLAIGLGTPDWIVARGFPRERVFRFAYFLDSMPDARVQTRPDGPFRICFVGQFIRRKRLDLLIESLGRVRHREFELVVIGSGPLEEELRHMAEARLGQGNVRWVGRLPMTAARLRIASCDCLALPSDHDGWGAVVIEALMSGTPVICSDACGSAIAVEQSGHGDIFRAGQLVDMAGKLQAILARGPVSPLERQGVADWAACYSAEAGAAYLGDIIACVYQGRQPPVAPWEGGRS